MSPPDRQVVVRLQDGTAADAVTRAAAESLSAKAGTRNLDSPIIALSASASAVIAPALEALGSASRLYLVGATAPDRGTIAGFTPAALAERLTASGLSAAVKISVVADHAALPEGEDAASYDAPPAAASRSFAAALHRILGNSGVRTELVARVGAVRVPGASDGADHRANAA